MIFDKNTFLTPEAQLTYILLQTDGRARMDALGVKELLYVDKERASKWYQGLLAILTDKNGPAAVKLSDMYAVMTREYPEEDENE